MISSIKIKYILHKILRLFFFFFIKTYIYKSLRMKLRIKFMRLWMDGCELVSRFKCLPRCLNFSILILIRHFTIYARRVRAENDITYTQTLKAMTLRDTALFHGYLSRRISFDTSRSSRTTARTTNSLVGLWTSSFSYFVELIYLRHGIPWDMNCNFGKRISSTMCTRSL